MRLTLLHFNDLHGRLEQLPRLFTLARRERAAARAGGRQVLLLDGGDSSDRGRWECEVTQGRANYSLLEAMGVQAGVPGNAETLGWGRAALAKMAAAVNFPVLAANLVDATDAVGADPAQPAVPGLKRSLLLDAGGFPLGLIGLTQVYPDAFAEAGYGLPETRAVLRREIEQLHSQGARLMVLLSHLGLSRNPASAAREQPEALHDDTVAQEFPEIAAIVGGHSHSVVESPILVGQTIIVQAGNYGRFLGRLDLDVDDASGRVTGYSGRLIACGADVPPDPTIQGTLELVIEEAARVKKSM